MKNVLLKTYPKLEFRLIDTGLVYKEETFAKCKICEQIKNVLLARLEIAVNNKNVVTAFFPCCEDCFSLLYALFKKLNGIDVEIGDKR